MKKKLFIFSILIIGLFESCFSKTNANKETNKYFTNKTQILGYSVNKNCVGLLTQKRNTGKGDIKYQYLIFDLQKNEVIDSLKSEYICFLYGEECILSDWDDEKYGADKYLSFRKQNIDSINALYGIDCKEIDSIQISDFHCDTEITDSTPLSESLNLVISFCLNEKKYQLNSAIKNQEFIKEISLEEVYSVEDFIILKIAKIHQGFEGENFKDFDFFAVKK